MSGRTVQLVSRGMPWVALVVVTAFGLRQLQLRKSAQDVRQVPLSATVPRQPASPVAAAVKPEVPAHETAPVAPPARPVAAPSPPLLETMAAGAAQRRIVQASERTQALLATSRAQVRAHAAARARLEAELAQAQDAVAEPVDSSAVEERAHAALLEGLARPSGPVRAGREARVLRRQALDGMASKSAEIRVAAHRLAMSLSLHAMLFDPGAPLSERAKRLATIEDAWR